MCATRLNAPLLCIGNKEKRHTQHRQRHEYTQHYMYICTRTRYNSSFKPDETLNGHEDPTHTTTKKKEKKKKNPNRTLPPWLQRPKLHKKKKKKKKKLPRT